MSASESSSACASSSSSDRLTQPRSSPRASKAATSGRDVTSAAATLPMLRRCGTGRRQAVERAPEQPRNVHLGDPHTLRDLGLRQVVLEAELENRPLARGQRLEGPAERLADLNEIVSPLLDTQ